MLPLPPIILFGDQDNWLLLLALLFAFLLSLLWTKVTARVNEAVAVSLLAGRRRRVETVGSKARAKREGGLRIGLASQRVRLQVVELIESLYAVRFADGRA